MAHFFAFWQKKVISIIIEYYAGKNNRIAKQAIFC